MRRRLIVVEQARGSQQHRALANRSDVFGLLALPDQKIEISVTRICPSAAQVHPGRRWVPTGRHRPPHPRKFFRTSK